MMPAHRWPSYGKPGNTLPLPAIPSVPPPPPNYHETQTGPLSALCLSLSTDKL
jgi:hypothetical protein